MEDKMIRLAGIAYESLVNGPGIRRVFFSQGCRHNCEDCFNPETHSFDGGKLMNMDELIDGLKGNTFVKGVTFSGGDPLEQADKFAYLSKNIKAMGLNVWCYTGYTFEYIIANKDKRNGWNELLKNIDVLVDGPFQKDKKSSSVKYRGSSNQRLIDVQKSLKNNEIATLKY